MVTAAHRRFLRVLLQGWGTGVRSLPRVAAARQPWAMLAPPLQGGRYRASNRTATRFTSEGTTEKGARKNENGPERLPVRMQAEEIAHDGSGMERLCRPHPDAGVPPGQGEREEAAVVRG